MHMEMPDLAPGEKLREVTGITGAQFRLERRAVASVVTGDQSIWPTARGTSFPFP
jgi:hypothetical protein